MYKYFTRAALLLTAIFLFSCESNYLEPTDNPEGKKGDDIAYIDLSQIDLQVTETQRDTYYWTWKIPACDLKKFDLLLCEEVREHVIKASYKVGTAGWVQIPVEFEEDSYLDNFSACDDYADDLVLQFPINQSGQSNVLIRLEIDEEFPIVEDATVGIFKCRYNSSYCCNAQYIEGPGCDGGGQEADCCYTCGIPAWAALRAGYCPFPGDDNSTYIVFDTYPTNEYPLFADEYGQVGTVTVTREDGKYSYEFDMDDDWFICRAYIQVFMNCHWDAWWIEDGNPLVENFSTKWQLSPCPVFEQVNGCLTTDYEWPEENLIIQGGQPCSVGKRIAIHLDLIYRECDEVTRNH